MKKKIHNKEIAKYFNLVKRFSDLGHGLYYDEGVNRFIAEVGEGSTEFKNLEVAEGVINCLEILDGVK